ncbi:MAG TPA: acylphosphatase [Ramlibacter sp.]|uniref:acylphosphatase n=1 Tax=Ramlibacter sp. TaxID=1917967 RepID=UPI002CD89B48|nr:acylphosphatase [Ramlibacter sp.]HVZ46429.1 acylphosphatase [Ramlibacter sp.]
MVDDTLLQTRLVRVRGRVQGIGYRDACIAQARSRSITGWVRNRMDDSVEALLQGTPAQLDAMCDWMENDMPDALVDGMDVTEVRPPFPHFDWFEARPTE